MSRRRDPCACERSCNSRLTSTLAPWGPQTSRRYTPPVAYVLSMCHKSASVHHIFACSSGNARMLADLSFCPAFLADCRYHHTGRCSWSIWLSRNDKCGHSVDAVRNRAPTVGYLYANKMSLPRKLKPENILLSRFCGGWLGKEGLECFLKCF
jgi:hypothetical protein